MNRPIPYAVMNEECVMNAVRTPGQASKGTWAVKMMQGETWRMGDR